MQTSFAVTIVRVYTSITYKSHRAIQIYRIYLSETENGQTDGHTHWSRKSISIMMESVENRNTTEEIVVFDAKNATN